MTTLKTAAKETTCELPRTSGLSFNTRVYIINAYQNWSTSFRYFPIKIDTDPASQAMRTKSIARESASQKNLCLSRKWRALVGLPSVAIGVDFLALQRIKERQ